MERHDPGTIGIHQRRHVYFSAFQRYGAFIQRKTVETRAIFGSKGLQGVQSAFFIEDRGIAFQCEGCVENPGTAARAFLGADFMRRAVGAEEVFCGT